MSAGSRITRDSPILFTLLMLAVLALVLTWRWRQTHTIAACVALWLSVAIFCSSHSARRMLPPRSDISTLVKSATLSFETGPVKRLPVMLQGQVVGHPRRGDFSVEFVVKCSAPRAGYVWLEAPLDSPVSDGMTLQINALLSDLPRPGNIGERSRYLRYIAERCWCLAKVKKVEDIQLQPHAASPWLTEWLIAIRSQLLAHYTTDFTQRGERYPAATAQLLSAMVFGEGALQQPLPRQTRDEFRAAGLSHILVASGTQISLFALLLLGLAKLLGLRRWWMLAAVLPALVFYALLTGGEASIWRATIGGLCLTIAILFGRDIDSLSLWSLALAALLVIDPAQLFSLSYQLTFAATWGLIVLAPHLARVLRSPFGESSVMQFMALSLGAQLATLPLLLYHFGRLSTIGIGANFLGVPLAGVLVSTGVLGLVLPPANTINYWLTHVITTVATIAARAPGAQVEASPIGLSWAILCYAGVLCAVLTASGAAMKTFDSNTIRDVVKHWWHRRRRHRVAERPQALVPLLLLLVIAFVAWHTFFSAPHHVRVTVLDVGQGESILIESPTGRAVLIDGGTLSTAERGDVGRSVIVPYLQSRGVRRLDAVVVTHADADHLNALPHVLREVPVAMILDGGASADGGTDHDTASEIEYQNLLAVAKQRKVVRKRPRAGQRLNLGDGAVLTVLSPLEPPLQSGNNNSIVLRLDYGQTSMLLTGDIEREAEERLIRRGANLHCTVLKVAHHGSKTSTSQVMMRASRPEAAVISCGRYNSFGHPAAQTLQQLTAAKAPVFRTDINGAVEITLDGRRCWIQTFR